jgi:hypothetical protein
LAVTLLAAAPFAAAVEDDPAAFFEARVRPVLLERCVSCHGPEKRKSDLQLDTAQGLFKGGSRGPVVVAGDPGASLLYQSVAGLADIEMPPDEPLAEHEVAALRQWIADGAVWPDYDPAQAAADPLMDAGDHWAFQPVRQPPLPQPARADWVKSPVDAFVLQRMEEAELSPAPPAAPETLLRRVTLDLTGLPPTPEEREAFLADMRPDAYERVVERLLASPQYGERWARHWLDVVRYTDSFDSRASTLTDPVEIWRYRDWVVKAFNDDMPYDDFLRYQIAGDLMPSADGGFNRDGLVATGVLAIGNWPQGDADKEKMVCDIVDDQVDLVTRGFMGLTVSCARCHDHKFEPFSTEDYYGLAGIFFSSSILPGPGAKTEGSPILHLPLASKEELAERAARESRLAELRAQRDALLQEERAAFAVAALPQLSNYLHAAMADEAPGTDLNAEAVRRWRRWLGREPGTLDGLTRDANGIPGLHARRGAMEMPSATLNLAGKDLHYVTIQHPDGALVVHPSPEAPAIVAWRSPVKDVVTLRAELRDADATCGNGFEYRVVMRSGTEETLLEQGAVDNGGNAVIALDGGLTVSPGARLRLEVGPRAGDYSCDSTTVEWRVAAVSGAAWELRPALQAAFLSNAPWPDGGHEAVWSLDDPNGLPRHPALEEALQPLLTAAGAPSHEVVTDVAARLMVLTTLDGSGSAAAPELREALLGAEGPFWLLNPPAPEGSPRPALETELAALEASPPPAVDLAVGIQEGAVPGTAYEGFVDVRVHRRGDYNNLGDVVPRRMPTVLAGDTQPPIAEGSGRRELAEWVASECNPLTARVMVNRIWLHHFGEGLVRTPGDFGTRGEAPTHPELLDHLAHAFVESGWSVKAVHRMMVLSAVYRQASTGNPAALERDPENRFFARMNRKRLEAEALRDSLLAASGQLNLEMGGPAFADLHLPRRTLYLKTNRSDRTTYAMLFDAADPTAIIPKRVEATVAPQALFLMNHPFVRQAAAELAAALHVDAPGVEALVERAYARLYGRKPTQRELELAVVFLSEPGGDSAARLESYCHALLCANEFAYVD